MAGSVVAQAQRGIMLRRYITARVVDTARCALQKPSAKRAHCANVKPNKLRVFIASSAASLASKEFPIKLIEQ